jgi:DMSO/TMAO reductase YedYZ molybdopterin-dependent catalytic subunit
MSIFKKNLPVELAQRIPPGNHLARGDWPVLSYGATPEFDEATWDFRLFGACRHPVTLTYPELKALPNVTLTADFHCVTRFSVLDLTWTGVPFGTLAELAKPLASAKWVIAHCDQGYTSNLSLEAMMDEDVLVACAKDGEPLTPGHGFPLRLVVPKRYAWKSAKWLRGLEFSEVNIRGFWEERGYHVHGDPWTEERYSSQEGPGAELEP